MVKDAKESDGIVKSYRNFKELIDGWEKDQLAADVGVQDWQRSAKPGDHFLTLPLCGVKVLPVFVEIIDPMDWWVKKGVVSALQLSGEALEEYTAELEIYKKPHMVNYRLTRSFSVQCPNGEMGDVHVSTLVKPLTSIEWMIFRRHAWDVSFVPEYKIGLDVE